MFGQVKLQIAKSTGCKKSFFFFLLPAPLPPLFFLEFRTHFTRFAFFFATSSVSTKVNENFPTEGKGDISTLNSGQNQRNPFWWKQNMYQVHHMFEFQLWQKGGTLCVIIYLSPRNCCFISTVLIFWKPWLGCYLCSDLWKWNRSITD